MTSGLGGEKSPTYSQNFSRSMVLATGVTPASVKVNLGASCLVLDQGLQNKFNVHLRLNALCGAQTHLWRPTLLKQS